MKARDLRPGDRLEVGPSPYTVLSVAISDSEDRVVARVKYDMDGGESYREFMLDTESAWTTPLPPSAWADRFTWTDPSQIEVTRVSDDWLAGVKVDDEVLGSLPPLGDKTCAEQEDEMGYWCSLPFDHQGNKHVAQGDARVVAVWTT